jgi:UDP:flavonoid glycosyltransferase YjiC (YdhE family)
VQPHIALGAGLQASGHVVTLATLGEFKSSVLEYGLGFDHLRGDFLKAAQASQGKSALKGRGGAV